MLDYLIVIDLTAVVYLIAKIMIDDLTLEIRGVRVCR